MPTGSVPLNYYEVITAAVKDIAEHGYDSEERIAYWAEQLRLAAERAMRSSAETERMVRAGMMQIFRREVDLGGVLRRNPGVQAYTLQMVRPQLHAELSRRIAASIDLIKLRKEKAVAETQARLRGWATSLPPGGSAKTDKPEQKANIRKALAQLPFEERRVIIDQNAKLFNAINTTVALNGDALGAIWHSHKYQRGYDGRPVHNARDGKFFLVRGSWAQVAGLVKPGPEGYTDEVEQPSELPFCKCSWQFIYSLRNVPAGCLTKAGEQRLREAREKVRNAA